MERIKDFIQQHTRRFLQHLIAERDAVQRAIIALEDLMKAKNSATQALAEIGQESIIEISLKNIQEHEPEQPNWRRQLERYSEIPKDLKGKLFYFTVPSAGNRWGTARKRTPGIAEFTSEFDGEYASFDFVYPDNIDYKNRKMHRLDIINVEFLEVFNDDGAPISCPLQTQQI